MLEAKAVSKVLPFLVQIFVNDNLRAVKNPIDVFFNLYSCWLFPCSFSLFVSFITKPSFTSTILVAYFSASSGLCVTIITNLSLAIFFINSIICTDVVESKAPVGSSASIISGLLTKALAIATLCICPPDNWFGFLWACSFNPTFSNTSIALFFFSFEETPDKVILSSIFPSTEMCPIKL